MANFVIEDVFEEGRTDCDKYDLTTIKLRKNIGEIKLNF